MPVQFVSKSPQDIRRIRAIGLRVKRHRTRIGLTQRRMAEDLGYVRSVISDIETGRYLPSTDFWLTYALVYRVSLDMLLLNRDMTELSSICNYTVNKIADSSRK